LVRALNQPDGELRAQRHDRAAPGLARGRIAETKRLKIIPGIVNKPLCPLVIQVQTSRTDKAEERRHSSIKASNARHALRRCGLLEGAEKYQCAQDHHDWKASYTKFMTEKHEIIIVWATIVVDQKGAP
jgi:hypothetical protein